MAAIFLAGVFLAGLDTASNSLVVAMLGPQRAPPFTQVNRPIIIIKMSIRSRYNMSYYLTVPARHGWSRLRARVFIGKTISPGHKVT